MKLAPHDMAKLGYLFLNNGLWDDQQVVSGAWVEAATSGSSYGYQWWIKPFGFFATGVGGQEIWVLPDRNMVVVMTGASGGGGSGAWGEQLMKSRILPLSDSTDPLPPNPVGIATLELQVQMAAASPHPEPVPPMPQIVQSVAGQTYVMDPNPAGLLSVSLTFPETAEALWNLSFSAGPDQTQVVEWPIGLDNVYRFTRNEYGLSMGIKGEWESEEVFVVHRDVIGGYERGERYRVTFDEGQITIKIQNMGGGEALTLVGYMEE